jgi:hypothetical protein
MRNLIVVITALLAISSTITVHAKEHSGHTMEHKSNVAYEEVVDGVKATFIIQTMAEAMKDMGIKMPKGMKETHHISVSFKDVKSGKMQSDGVITVKVQNPDKSTQVKDLMGMQGHFGADFEFSGKGKYGVMCKFQLKDGKTRQAKFWYQVK